MNFRTLKSLGFCLFCLTLVIGCGRPEGEKKIPKTDSSLKDAQGQSIAFDVDSLPLKQLLQDPNLRVRKNAEQAYKNLGKNDFSKAMYNLTALASMPLNNAQTDIVATTLKEVVKVVKAAADGGNENAKFALRILADSGF